MHGVQYVDQAKAFAEDGTKAFEANLLLGPISEVEMSRVQTALDGVNTNDLNSVLQALGREFGYTTEDTLTLMRQLGFLDGTTVRFTIQGRWDIPPPPAGVSLPAGVVPTWVDGNKRSFHEGGIVGGIEGTREVLAVLEKGEGVIDRDTMRDGFPTVMGDGSGGNLTIVVDGNLFGAATVDDLVDLIDTGQRQAGMRQGINI